MSSISYPDEGNQRCFELEDQSFWFKVRNKVISHFVRKYATKGNFVDVGGGNGYVARGLQDLDFQEVCLVEPGPDGCKNAARRGLKSIFNGLLKDYRPGDQFDNIGLFDVVEHIEEDVSFLKEVASRTTKEGKVFITVPAYSFLWSSEDVIAGHSRRYTLTELIGKCEMAGFQVVYASYFFVTLLPLIYFLRALPYKFSSSIQNAGSGEEHRSGLVSKILEFVLRLELGFLRFWGKFPVGSSIILVLTRE